MPIEDEYKFVILSWEAALERLDGRPYEDIEQIYMGVPPAFIERVGQGWHLVVPLPGGYPLFVRLSEDDAAMARSISAPDGTVEGARRFRRSTPSGAASPSHVFAFKAHVPRRGVLEIEKDVGPADFARAETAAEISLRKRRFKLDGRWDVDFMTEGPPADGAVYFAMAEKEVEPTATAEERRFSLPEELGERVHAVPRSESAVFAAVRLADRDYAADLLARVAVLMPTDLTADPGPAPAPSA